MPLPQKITWISPIDGDMLNDRNDGVRDGLELIIPVRIQAPVGSLISVNDIEAQFRNGFFLADVPLKEFRNRLEVSEERTGYRNGITVFWLKDFTGKYRLSLDDNIWCLEDLTQNAAKYKSLFDNSYLGFLRQVHETYGSKIHINIFFETEGFNLSQMTDKYRAEWKANAGWLRLSFHSLGEFPDRPYINAGYDQVKRDCNLVLNEIRRFAGSEVLGSETTIHWGEATVEGCRALRDEGYDKLVGYFTSGPDPVSYYLTKEQRGHLNDRAIWHDTREGITFVRIGQVINLYTLDEVVPALVAEVAAHPRRSEFLELMIHEQYFHSAYHTYQPDFRDKVLAAVQWAVSRGYQPAFLEECVR